MKITQVIRIVRHLSTFLKKNLDFFLILGAKVFSADMDEHDIEKLLEEAEESGIVPLDINR